MIVTCGECGVEEKVKDVDDAILNYNWQEVHGVMTCPHCCQYDPKMGHFEDERYDNHRGDF